MNRFARILTAAVLTLGVSAMAQAAPITFYGVDPGAGPGGPRVNSNAAATLFDAAAGALGTINIIDFEAAPVGYFPPAPLTVAAGVDVTMTGTVNDSGAGINAGAGDATLGYNTTAGGDQFLRLVPQFDIGTAGMRFSFATPIEAFGAYITGLGTAAGSLHVMFDDGTAQDLPVVGNDLGGALFFGFTDAGRAISAVDLVLTGVTGGTRDIFSVDDVRFVPAAIPEPSLLLLGGVALAAGFARRLR